MEYQVFMVLLCAAGAMAACGIQDDADVATGGKVGEMIELVCGFDRNSDNLQWEFTDVAGDDETIYSTLDGSNAKPIPGYSLDEYTINNIDYINLQIDSASNDRAGKYTCKCLGSTGDSKNVEVVVISKIEMNDGEDNVVADEDVLINCTVTYAASRALVDATNQNRVTITMEDSEGATVTEPEDEQLFDIDNTANTNWMKEAYGRHVFIYTDDGEDFTCHVTVGGDIITNMSRTLTVWHQATNFSLSPVDTEYYREEKVTVLYNANPEPHTKQLWVWTDDEPMWQLLDDEENAENEFTVDPEWPDSVVLRVDMISRFPDESEDRNSSWTEPLTIVDCCRTSDTPHVTFSIVLTSLLVLVVSLVTSR